MKKKRLLATLLLLFASSAQAMMVWQPAPASPTSSSAPQGHTAHRRGKPLRLSAAQGAEAEMWLPTRVRRPLHIGPDGRVEVSGTGVDNYHLLIAKKREAGRESVAMRYLYQHGKPSGESPVSLVNQNKATLEIVPAPLTREHQRYQSLKPFAFVIRFQDRPLDNCAVTLSTSNGSELTVATDERGRAVFHLPDDFSAVVPGRRNNKPAEFVIAAAHQFDDMTYRTTLSAPYYVSPSHWRSTSGGLAAMFAGVLTGFVVLRRSRHSGKSAGRG